MSARYVVCSTTTLPDSGHVITNYWFGPAAGWGTTYGPRSMTGIATFTSRDHAERALRKVYGTMAAAKRRGCSVVRDG